MKKFKFFIQCAHPKVYMKKILIIEDDPILIELTLHILQKRGFIIETLNQTDQLFDQLKKNKPDLIILDNLLEGKITGLELAAQIKADQNYSAIPILLTTGQDLHTSIFKNGPDDYLKKPFEPEVFIQKINALLKV